MSVGPGKRTLQLLLCLASLGALSCATPRVVLTEQTRAFTPDDYAAQLSQWTREGEQYRDLESRLFLKGTFLSWSFRQAQVVYREKNERLPRNDVIELMAHERAASRDSHEFFLAAHTHEWAWNRLERTGEDAMWRIRLINDKGESLAPTRIERIGIRNARYTGLYPYYGQFYVGYRVRFPRLTTSGADILAPGTRRFIVRVSGPQAAVDLVWEAAVNHD